MVGAGTFLLVVQVGCEQIKDAIAKLLHSEGILQEVGGELLEVGGLGD
jgi:hypothetical protein